MKPPTPVGMIAASVPPTTMISASPLLIDSTPLLKAVKPPIPVPTRTPILVLSICHKHNESIAKDLMSKIGIIEGPLACNNAIPPAIIKATIIFAINIAY
ncbi:hypothetical protein CR513_61567, partial [Mucuna pruriens]